MRSGKLGEASRGEPIASLPPLLVFQSVLDFTVSTSAIAVSLCAQLREKGREVILFDINRAIPSSQLSHASMRCAF
jgi:hypothetical protein